MNYVKCLICIDKDCKNSRLVQKWDDQFLHLECKPLLQLSQFISQLRKAAQENNEDFLENLYSNIYIKFEDFKNLLISRVTQFIGTLQTYFIDSVTEAFDDIKAYNPVDLDKIEMKIFDQSFIGNCQRVLENLIEFPAKFYLKEDFFHLDESFIKLSRAIDEVFCSPSKFSSQSDDEFCEELRGETFSFQEIQPQKTPHQSNQDFQDNQFEKKNTQYEKKDNLFEKKQINQPTSTPLRGYKEHQESNHPQVIQQLLQKPDNIELPLEIKKEIVATSNQTQKHSKMKTENINNVPPQIEQTIIIPEKRFKSESFQEKNELAQQDEVIKKKRKKLPIQTYEVKQQQTKQQVVYQNFNLSFDTISQTKSKIPEKPIPKIQPPNVSEIELISKFDSQNISGSISLSKTKISAFSNLDGTVQLEGLLRRGTSYTIKLELRKKSGGNNRDYFAEIGIIDQNSFSYPKLFKKEQHGIYSITSLGQIYQNGETRNTNLKMSHNSIITVMFEGQLNLLIFEINKQQVQLDITGIVGKSALFASLQNAQLVIKTD